MPARIVNTMFQSRLSQGSERYVHHSLIFPLGLNRGGPVAKNIWQQKSMIGDVVGKDGEDDRTHPPGSKYCLYRSKAFNTISDRMDAFDRGKSYTTNSDTPSVFSWLFPDLSSIRYVHVRSLTNYRPHWSCSPWRPCLS